MKKKRKSSEKTSIRNRGAKKEENRKVSKQKWRDTKTNTKEKMKDILKIKERCGKLARNVKNHRSKRLQRRRQR